MQTTVLLNDLATALAEAQDEFPVVVKDKTAKVPTKSGGEYKYNYADYAAVIEAATPVLKKHGLSFVQTTGFDPEIGHTLTTMLLHVSGQWISDTMKLLLPQDTPQVHGSAITYAKRYALSAMLGIAADEDDDGGVAQAAFSDSSPKRAKAPSSSKSTKQTTAAASKETGEAFDSRSRNKVVAHFAKMDPPVRGDDVAVAVSGLLGLDEPTQLALLTQTQGLKLMEELGVEA